MRRSFRDVCMYVCWLCWGLTSRSTIFQSCRDGAIASWVINQYFRGVKCLAQGHNTAEVGLEPRTSRSGVQHSTTEPPRSPMYVCMYLSVPIPIEIGTHLTLPPSPSHAPYPTNNTHPYPYPMLPLSLLKFGRNDSRPKRPRAETTHLLRPKRPTPKFDRNDLDWYSHPIPIFHIVCDNSGTS